MVLAGYVSVCMVKDLHLAACTIFPFIIFSVQYIRLYACTTIGHLCWHNLIIGFIDCMGEYGDMCCSPLEIKFSPQSLKEHPTFSITQQTVEY